MGWGRGRRAGTEAEPEVDVDEVELESNDPAPPDESAAAVSKLGRDERRDPTRVRLAHFFMLLLCVDFVVGAIGWCYGHDLTQWVSYSSPLFTLVGVVVTFYFTETKD